MYSIIYHLDGQIEYTTELKNNKTFFRKYIDTSIEFDNTELVISKILLINPHPNIVKIYEVTNNYIDMELLYSITYYSTECLEDIKLAIEHLHKLNIVYIDLKLSNIGYSIDTEHFKLFDFNCSGILLYKSTWLIQPCICSFPYKYLSTYYTTNFFNYDYIMLDKFESKIPKKTSWTDLFCCFFNLKRFFYLI